VANASPLWQKKKEQIATSQRTLLAMTKGGDCFTSKNTRYNRFARNDKREGVGHDLASLEKSLRSNQAQVRHSRDVPEGTARLARANNIKKDAPGGASLQELIKI
jgi:hypothetical protein